MPVKKYRSTEAKYKKWIQEGRGSGHGRNYKPWLTVRDLASKGRSHRIFGHKSQRTHQLLSDIELAVFFLLEWQVDTDDIREQFPLRIEDTLALAKSARIAHPSMNGVAQVMSTDFLVNSHKKSLPKYAIQAKHIDALGDPRTIEKLELERRYWAQKDVPWKIITNEDIPKTVIENINWLYPAQRDELDTEIVIERVEFYSQNFERYPNRTIIDIAKKLDIAYQLSPGKSLLELRQLLANRCFLFDITVPARKLKASELTMSNITSMIEVRYVSNQ